MFRLHAAESRNKNAGRLLKSSFIATCVIKVLDGNDRRPYTHTHI